MFWIKEPKWRQDRNHGVSLNTPRPAPPCLASTRGAKDQSLKHLAAPGIPIDSPVMLTDMIMDGNLGQPFLSQYVVTLDLKTSRL